jgi:hypothetical protein
MSPCSKVVEYLTRVLIIKGSNHATGNEREKNDDCVFRYILHEAQNKASNSLWS